MNAPKVVLVSILMAIAATTARNAWIPFTGRYKVVRIYQQPRGEQQKPNRQIYYSPQEQETPPRHVYYPPQDHKETLETIEEENNGYVDEEENQQKQELPPVHVDFGAHTGHGGAFGWYADFPAPLTMRTTSSASSGSESNLNRRGRIASHFSNLHPPNHPPFCNFSKIAR